MKVRNNSSRNQGLVALHPRHGGMPERAVVPAGSVLSMKDSEWKKFSKSAIPLLSAKVLELTEAPVSKYSKEEIKKAIKEGAGIIASSDKTKQELQDLAEILGVDLDAILDPPEVVEEVKVVEKEEV